MAAQTRTVGLLLFVVAAGVAAAVFLATGGGPSTDGEPPDTTPGAGQAASTTARDPVHRPGRSGTAGISGEVRRRKGRAAAGEQEVLLVPAKGDPWSVRTDAAGAFAF